jgi:hypothetical protein
MSQLVPVKVSAELQAQLKKLYEQSPEYQKHLSEFAAKLLTANTNLGG